MEETVAYDHLLRKYKDLLKNVKLDFIMSHLANAQEHEDKKNLMQLYKIKNFNFIIFFIIDSTENWSEQSEEHFQSLIALKKRNFYDTYVDTRYYSTRIIITFSGRRKMGFVWTKP